MLPTTGRNLLYYYGHEKCPALCIASDEKAGTVDLVAFSPSAGTLYMYGVKQSDPSAKAPDDKATPHPAANTWQWPTQQREKRDLPGMGA